MVKERRKTSGAAQQDRLANAMIPLVPEILPDLTNKHIFMSSGLYDPVVPKQEAERLFGLFKKNRNQGIIVLAK